MKIIARPKPVLDVAEQVEDLRLDRHVERRHGSSHNEHIGLSGERPSDRDALPLAARKRHRPAREQIASPARPGPQLHGPLRLRCRRGTPSAPGRRARMAADRAAAGRTS